MQKERILIKRKLLQLSFKQKSVIVDKKNFKCFSNMNTDINKSVRQEIPN